MESIPKREPVELLKAELLPHRLLRCTNRGGNLIYVFTAHEAPHLMRELGRLREISFRMTGGGTGKALDIDAYDLAENPYKQMIVWSPVHDEILGAYRFHFCGSVAKLPSGEANIATSKIFNFSEQFVKQYQPYAIEMGRSFVATTPNETNRSKNIFALDNLWDGLAAIIANQPKLKYLLGKVTVYPQMDAECKRLLYGFLHVYFCAQRPLLTPREAEDYLPWPKMDSHPFTGKDYEKEHRLLSHLLRQRDGRIPPLINSYMGLSSSMQCFATTINRGFGKVEDTAIMLNIAELYPHKINRHFN